MEDVEDGFLIRRVSANGTTINVATGGSGPAILFLHGWPHTWEIWRDVMEVLSTHFTVVAPDLRGLGSSAREESGYDLRTLADDAAGLLDALGLKTVSVVGIDLGTAISWMLATTHPDRVNRLVVMEGLLGTLPGAGAFLENGPPWWFGFHGVPGLAEEVLDGNETAYVDWFLRAGTKDRKGVPAKTRQAFVDAYNSPEAMRCGFEHYRAFAENAHQIGAAAAAHRITVPVLAIAGGVVGGALAGQLRGVAADLTEVAIADCAHLIPVEQPAALTGELRAFLA